MDSWLYTKGLFRKNTAMDGSCIFRAVSEQLYKFIPEDYHLHLRMKMVDFMVEHRDLFESKITEVSFEEYVENMRDPSVWAGSLEIEALSHMLKVDFLIYKEVEEAPVPATNNGFQKTLRLCFTKPYYYDSIYDKEYIDDCGFCQSVVYSILYGRVFQLSDLDYAVKKMLHDKNARAQREKYLSSQNWSKEDNSIESYIEEAEGPIKVKELIDQGAILFPYKVAKALDPNLFRNISFDCWQDRRGNRKGKSWFLNGGPLRPGVVCAVNFNNHIYKGHIQSMAPDQGPVEVYVEQLSDKIIVPYESLIMLPRTSVRPEWSFSMKHIQINKGSCKHDGHERKRYKGRKSQKDSSSVNSQQQQQQQQMPSPEIVDAVALPTATVETPVPIESNQLTPPKVATTIRRICAPIIGDEVSAVNVSATKISSNDDLRLYDADTIRFFFNLGIEYFATGRIIFDISSPTTVSTPISYTEDRRKKIKIGTNNKTPPRFRKLELSLQELETSGHQHQQRSMMNDSGLDMSPSSAMEMTPPPPTACSPYSINALMTPELLPPPDEAFFSVPLPEMCPMPAFPSMNTVPVVTLPPPPEIAVPLSYVDAATYYGFETPPPDGHYHPAITALSMPGEHPRYY